MCDLPNNCTMATTTPPPTTTTPMTCPLPCQTVQNGACYPECCEDEDCSGGLCDSGGSCQLGDCRRGSDCTGYNTLCHEPWQQGADNCEYCDNMDTNQEIGSCQPGCESSDHNMCPPANDMCTGIHGCTNSGATLLKKIHLTTGSCSGCSNDNIEGGAHIHVVATRTDCFTENLDHTNAQDYSAQHTAVFESGVDVGLMAQCNNVEVAGGPKSVEITWKGSGTWTPSEVKLEVSRAYFYACTPLTGISQDQTATLTCNDMLCKTCEGISRKLTSFVSFSANAPGPESIALIVPDVKACSLLTMNSWPSDEMSLTYIASVPSQPPKPPAAPPARSPVSMESP